MADLIGIYNHIQNAGKAGRAQYEKREIGSSLGRLLSGGDRNAEMSSIAQINPDAAVAAGSFMGQMDEQKLKRLGQFATMYTAAPPEVRAQMYPQIAQEANAMGFPVPLDHRPEIDGMLASLAQKTGGAEQFTLSPGSKRFGPDGRVIAEVPFAPERPDYIFQTDADGNGYWIPKPTGAPQQPSAPAPTTGGGAQVMDSAYQSGLGFDPLRDAVEYHESRGNPNAVSPKGAMGRMQTMPGTLRDPGFGIQPARDQSDAEMTRVGNEYLQAMLQKYGAPELALAAYNWGPGNVDRALQQSGGDPRAVLASAPQETQQYVRNVLSTAGGQSGPARPQAVPGGAIPIPGFRGAPKAGTQNEIEKRRAEIAALRQSGVEMSPAEERAYLLSGKPIDDGKPAKPLPVTALKLIKEESDAIQAADEMNFILNRARERIQSGELDLSFLGNLQAKGVNLFGNPGNNKSARNFQSFMSDLQKARNASLRLNKGVQTEGDAQRAWDELFKNVTDEAFVLQRMAEIEEINERAMTFRQGNIDMVRQNYGIGPAEDDPAEDVESLLDMYR